MNSKWQIYRVGLVDFWYYDEEEFYFLDGRMLLRGANGSGKSVTMQSFIPLLLDGNMRPERLDPFGSRARKMENYLLEEGDGREERTGYLYMELKRRESDEFLTLGIGMRARRNKKMDSWYFCITDGRRIGKDFYLYKELQNKMTYTMRELKNRIGEGGKVMETQSEYAQCVNRLLFGFETQEEYKELLDLLIQLRTPKLSKDFKPTVINEILSSSLQTLSEDDLRPLSEAIENMDTTKTNLDALQEGIAAAEQIEKVYDQYNRIVLYDKARWYLEAVRQYAALQKEIQNLEEKRIKNEEETEKEKRRYEDLEQERKILQEERESLSDSDAAKLKEQEMDIRAELEEIRKEMNGKLQQENDKKEKYLDTEGKLRMQEEAVRRKWKQIEECLEQMEEEMEDVPFEEFAFMKEELCGHKEEAYSFASHAGLLRQYTQKVEKGKEILTEEKNCQERYSRLSQELDRYRDEKSKVERDLLQYENQLHEIRQELIEKLYQWEQGKEIFHLDKEVLQEMSRRIEGYSTEMDYLEIRNLGKEVYEQSQQELFTRKMNTEWRLEEQRKVYRDLKQELVQWQEEKEAEPQRSEEIINNRKKLEERNIPFLPFYQAVDFKKEMNEIERGRLEETLLQMGLLDALIIPADYREKVLALDEGVRDRYLFTDAEKTRDNLLEFLDVDNPENDIFRYQNVSRVLGAIAVRKENESIELQTEGFSGSWMDSNGNFGMGVLEGNITKEYTACLIGAGAREQYRLQKIEEFTNLCKEKEEEISEEERVLEEIHEKIKQLEKEWNDFPAEQDIKIAAKEYEKQEEKLTGINERVREQRDRVEKERKTLDEIRLQVQEICKKCYLSKRLDLFVEVLAHLHEYRDILTKLQISHVEYVNGIQSLRVLKEHLEDIDRDLDDIRYDLGRVQKQKKEREASLALVIRQLELTDYEKIRERLDFCTKRLLLIPGEKETAARNTERMQMEKELLEEKILADGKEAEQASRKKEWLREAFVREYRLGYVKETLEKRTEEDTEKLAGQICHLFSGQFGNKKQMDLMGSVQEEYHKNRGYLLEYQMTLKTLFEELDQGSPFAERSMKRIDIATNYHGVSLTFQELISKMKEDAEILKRLLSEKDRELFEDILANTISKKIRAKIYGSKRWVEEMNHLMGAMQTSSGLTLSLRWKNKQADKEEQLGTRELVELLQKDAEIMRPEEAAQLSRHFRSKMEEARKEAGDKNNLQSFHAIMREVLDYRQWFEFQLECQKAGEKKKELTDRVFFTFSGGEKAMSMYVPLFSAVVAKYAGARKDAPRLISLDEAFAGVDEMNIRDMFRLMVEFDFNFMINSQILWGDYDTVPGLAIYQLIRPENAKYVTVIRYEWNGKVKQMAVGKQTADEEQKSEEKKPEEEKPDRPETEREKQERRAAI